VQGRQGRAARATAAGWLALAALGLAGCSRAPGTFGPFPGAPVVLISIDTLRADRLPAYGYAAGRTPALDALAREGIVFEDVYSHCPLTLPAHASMLTGLLPPHHGVRDNIGFSLEATHETLASRFRVEGWRTGAAVSAYVLREQTGIGQGFELYDDAIEIEGDTMALGTLQRDGSVAVEVLARWIEKAGGQPFFAFLHLYEPHSPHSPPERFRSLADPYDGEVAYADELVGRFLDRLKSDGLYDRSVIVVTSDHGEGLNDHGEEEHGIFLYREAVHVPLIVRVPGGVRSGTRVDGTVSQVDIAATILDLAGLPVGEMDGVPLRPLVEGQTTSPRTAYSETLYPRYHFGWSELYAATSDRYRYIDAPRPELFDVRDDPAEKRNLVDSHGDRVRALGAWLAEQKGSAEPARPGDVPEEMRERLQALGYIGSGAAEVEEGEPLPDPKDRIASYEKHKRGLVLRREGRDEEAVALFREVLNENPRMLDAWEMLGLTLVRMGRTEEGLAALDEALKIAPDRAETHLTLARIYGLDGRTDRAIEHAELAARRNPGKAYEVLGQLMMDEGRFDEAAAYARKSLAADDGAVMSHFILGLLAQREERYEEALASYRRAEEAKRLRKSAILRDLHANMGECLAHLGREAEAERELLKELEILPYSRKGRQVLAMLYRSQGRTREARAVLGGLVEAEPNPTADTYWTVVLTFSMLDDREAARHWAARARQLFPKDPRFRAGP
jgi:tetratricopeptide (TPR) repeat protein